MSTIDDKRTAFHSYLASSGVISALSKALIKLYEEPIKPDDPVNFVRRHMGSEDFFIVGDGKCSKDPNVEGELILSSLTEKTMEDGNVSGVTEKKSEVIEDTNEPYEQTEGPSDGNVEVLDGKDDGDVNVEEQLSQLQEAFDKFKLNEDCKSLLKTHLTDELFAKFKNELSGGGASFFECIKSGVENSDSVVGIYAIDYQSYDKFNELFDPVIEEYHGFGRNAVQPNSDWGDSNTFESFDENDIVMSLRISCVRNLRDYPFVCKMLEEDLNDSFAKIKTIIERFNDESSKGIFYNLTDLTQDQETELKNSGALMDTSNRNLPTINLYQQWPVGRGVFVSESIIIQVNGEDHLKFISNKSGNHFDQTYQRLVDAVNFFELTFARHDRLGWLTFTPTNLGTALNLEAELKLPKLHSNPGKLQEVVAAHSMLQLKPSDTGAEASFIMYNQLTMGSTEFELVKQFYDSIKEVIECEENEE